MNCYNCDAELTKDNLSREHIIPNFLGGRLTSTQLLCKKCNNEFGSTIDKELYDQLGFAADLIVSKRHRKKTDRGIVMETLSGHKRVVGHKLLPKPKLTIKIPTKKEAIEISGENDESLKQMALEKKKQLAPKFGDFTFTESMEYPSSEKYHFKNKISEKIGEIGFGGSEYFRAVGKIVLNFYLTKKKAGKRPDKLIEFVSGKTKKNDLVFAYHPDNYKIHDLTENEFSHIIHLRAEKEIGAVYCYLELFNFEKYLCIIDGNYEGDDFEETYCYDCFANKVVNKKIVIDLKKHHLEIMHLVSKGHVKKRQISFNEFEKRTEQLQDL